MALWPIRHQGKSREHDSVFSGCIIGIYAKPENPLHICDSSLCNLLSDYELGPRSVAFGPVFDFSRDAYTGLKRLLLCSVTTLPFLFPAAALLANESVNQIDQNVDFRRIVWRQIYHDFSEGSLVFGRLGQVVNRDFVDMLMRYGAAWEGAENIGAHNFPLQMTQLFGVAGLIATIFFFVALLRMTLPLIMCPGIVFCFLAIVVSLTLNQAEAHLLYQFGTALLIGCISAAYMSREVPAYSRVSHAPRIL